MTDIKELMKIVEAEGSYEAFDHAGLPCIMTRPTEMLHWCGYVGLPLGHWATADYGQLDINVHGGLTYGGINEEFGTGLYWVGFDCHHHGDIAPGSTYETFEGAVYRNAEYVRAELKSLAEQLAGDPAFYEGTASSFKYEIALKDAALAQALERVEVLERVAFVAAKAELISHGGIIDLDALLAIQETARSALNSEGG